MRGGTWVIRVNKEFLPNKEKAAVIELTGEMPLTGEVFKAMKKRENQYLINSNPVWDIETQFEEAELVFSVTRAMYESDGRIIRVLQNKGNNTCTAIDEVFISLIDENAMDQGKETMVEGPVGNDRAMYWKNNVMVMAAGIIKPVENTPLAEYLQHLSHMELEKKKMLY